MLKKVSIAVLTVLLATVLVVFLWNEKSNEQTRAEQAEQLNSQIQPIQQEIDALRKERAELTAAYEAEALGKGVVTLMFLDPCAELVDFVCPQMREAGLVGTLAFSAQNLPGASGALTEGEFQSLIEQGWSYCLAWDGSGDLQDWLSDMETALDDAGMEMPDAMYFPPGSYSSQLAETLGEDFRIAVHHGEERLPLLIQSASEADAQTEPGRWLPGAYGWYDDYGSDLVWEAMDSGCAVVLTVGTEVSEGTLDTESFSAMMEALGSWQKEANLLVANLDKAYSYRQDVAAGAVKVSTKLTQKQDEIDQKIDDLQKQLDDIYE